VISHVVFSTRAHSLPNLEVDQCTGRPLLVKAR
jgi:hypothetical protein